MCFLDKEIVEKDFISPPKFTGNAPLIKKRRKIKGRKKVSLVFIYGAKVNVMRNTNEDY